MQKCSWIWDGKARDSFSIVLILLVKEKKSPVKVEGEDVG